MAGFDNQEVEDLVRFVYGLDTEASAATESLLRSLQLSESAKNPMNYLSLPIKDDPDVDNVYDDVLDDVNDGDYMPEIYRRKRSLDDSDSSRLNPSVKPRKKRPRRKKKSEEDNFEESLSVLLEENPVRDNLPKFQSVGDDLAICPVTSCNFLSNSKDELLNHLSKSHTKTKCVQCGVIVKSEGLQDHFKTHTGDNKLETKPQKAEFGQFQCSERNCFFFGDTKSSLADHVKFHGKEFCLLCDRVINQAQFQKHMSANHEKRDPNQTLFECLECEEHFEDSESHRLMHEDSYRDCAFCHVKFGGKEKLESHEWQCMPTPTSGRSGKFKNRRKFGPTANIVVPFKEDRPNECPYEGCGFTAEKQSRVRGHYFSRHCRQKCPYCDAILGVYGLERHIMVLHTKKFNFVCHICSAGFFKESELSNHIEEEHIKDPKYICEDCGAAFFSNKKMYAHRFRSHKANSWKCEPCGKTYTAQSSLIKHLKRYHNGEGIDKLFKDKQGNYKQVRVYRHVGNEDLAAKVASTLLDSNTIASHVLGGEAQAEN